ncbi:hypothetical protein LWI29_016046 [Acer saccharum]|uniref:Uncharacterized protein n=1 Tax=Acer saccharum TaxID=4024 RepID=A0AA39W6E6_ACESA|nr:hypothetical protein LWI29_016046 [Acer saccharum]
MAEEGHVKADKLRVEAEKTIIRLVRERKELDSKASQVKKDLKQVQKELEAEVTRSTRRALERNELKIELATTENRAVAAIAKAAAAEEVEVEVEAEAEAEAGADKSFGDDKDQGESNAKGILQEAGLMVSAKLRSTRGEHLGSVTGQLDVEEDTFEEEMPGEERGGPTEELEEVVVREENPPKTVKIGSTLAPEHKAVLQKVLRDYNDVFTWPHEEMPGIPPNLAAHQLNVDPTFKPVKQKRR